MPPDPVIMSKASDSGGTPLLPEPIRGIVERARMAAQNRDWPEAYRCWNDVLTHAPHLASAYIGAGQALRQSGRHDEAELTLREGAERLPDNEQIAIARAWLANTRRDWTTALSRWESVRERFPENPWCYLGSANALRAAGRPEDVNSLLATAESMLIAAKQRGLDAAAASLLELELARTRFDWPGVKQSAKKIIGCVATPSAQVLLALARACWNTGDRDEADRAAADALSADPTLSEALVIRAWAATERGDGETALWCYRTLAELDPGAVRWQLKVVQLLNWFGRVNEAMNELENVRKRWPDDPIVRTFVRNYGPAASQAFFAEPTSDAADEKEIQAVANKAPKPEEQKRPLIVAAPEHDVILGQVPGAERAVLVFTGSNDAVSMPLAIFDRYLAPLNVTAIYLKDFNRLRFLRGIQSLSNDYAGTLAALRDLLNRYAVKRLCTIGNCDGGFAAVRYGVELCAERIVAFSAPTYSPQDALTKIEQARNFMRNRLAAKVPGDMIDLKPFLESRRYRAQIALFYEEEDDRDRPQALHLKGLPGIRLHPQPGLSNHHLLRRLALSRQNFRSMLAELLGLETPANI